MKRITLPLVLAIGATACGDDTSDDDTQITEVTVRGVVVDPDLYLTAKLDNSLSLQESLAAASLPNIPVAVDVRPDVRVMTDASGAFELKVPANSKLPLHWHSSAERMILVAGELRVTYEGQAATTLKAGTYAYRPAKKPHHGHCVSAEPCVLFIAFETPVDAVPVEGKSN